MGGGLLTTLHNHHYLVDAVWQKVPDVKFSQFQTVFHCSTTKGSFSVTKSHIHSFSKLGLGHQMFSSLLSNRPFPSSLGPLFQNEGRCSAFDMEIIFHSHANETYFHKKGCAPCLILK